MWNNFVEYMSNGSNLVFFFFALFAIGGAVFMISFTRVVHMLVATAFTFLSLAGLYVLLHAEFLGFVQILIYAGAVSILMIFGIMMTRHEDEDKQPRRPVHNFLILVSTLGLFFILFYAIQAANFPTAPVQASTQDNTLEIANQLFTMNVIPFELASVLLTVAFIGAIVIAKREGD
ncbi:MAG: NADH:ubiquinone oxidoreductase subunit J [Paenibacillus sp. RIFOXYA1_FULL_44_5]|nr:MAG: NADH:ubiquinone oxidoreductase subunit J [Paenibacillus sp. RIFOXYA1_FULL_44_5]